MKFFPPKEVIFNQQVLYVTGYKGHVCVSIRDDLICQVLHLLSGCVSITRLMMKHRRALLTEAEALPPSLINAYSASCDDPLFCDIENGWSKIIVSLFVLILSKLDCFICLLWLKGNSCGCSFCLSVSVMM